MTEPVARVDPRRAGPLAERVQVRHAHGELADDGAGVDALETEGLPRVVGSLQHQPAELDDALLAEPRQVDRPGQRVQRLGRADVVRCLLAADVLLARLQRQHEAALAVGVDGLARDATGHAADVALGRGEEPERRAAEVKPVAERLALADADVGAEVARRLEDPERQRIGGDDEQRAGALGCLGQRSEILDRSQEVRLLEDDCGGVVVDGGGERVEVGRAMVVQRRLDDLGAEAGRVGEECGARMRMDAARDDDLPSPVLELRHVAGCGDGRRSLVDRGVRHRQSRQLRDRRLELEHHLQRPLRDLGLVRRVRRQELRAQDDGVDDRRHVVVVHPGADEGDLLVRVPVPSGERSEMLVDLLLGLAGRQVERPPEADPLRDLREQCIH